MAQYRLNVNGEAKSASVDADTPEQLRALAHPLRSLILDLVLERAMSVTELAERVGRPRGSVAHHVDVLVDAGLLLQIDAEGKSIHYEYDPDGRLVKTIDGNGNQASPSFPFSVGGSQGEIWIEFNQG